MSKCHYCRVTLTRTTATNHRADMYTRDHIHPKSLGGTKTVPCCLRCNGMKGNLTAREWNQWRADTPDWSTIRRPASIVIAETKAAQRAAIFARLRIQAIQPVWPVDVAIAMPPLCRGLTYRSAA